MVRLDVNGSMVDLDIDPRMPLLWALRDFLGLTGTKYGCGRAFCGACTVHIDGEAARSCSIMVEDARKAKDIRTIEGVFDGELKDVAFAVRDAWRQRNVVQCGYCQSGQIMSAIILLSKTPDPTDLDIKFGMEGNICRCGTYQRISDAIKQAARALREKRR
jgi:isoquinoline 1-oxidoreductase alpha subunit